MSKFREQAINDVAAGIIDTPEFILIYSEMNDAEHNDDNYGRAVAYAVSQRERVLQLEHGIKQAILHLDEKSFAIVRQHLEDLLSEGAVKQIQSPESD